MGQYHMLVNLDKREYIYSHQLGDGLKAWEQFASGPGGVASAAVYLMVCPDPRGGGDFKPGEYMGRWHGDWVTWVGDYAEKDDFDASVYVGDNGEAITVHADIVYPLCIEDEDERQAQIEFSQEILEDTDRPEAFHDAAARILKALKAGIYFTNITPQVREVMEGELEFWEYYTTEYGTVSRREKPQDGTLKGEMARQGLKPDMILGDES